MANYYEILEVEQTASRDEIRKSYHRLALRWHPDKNPDNREEAENKFKLITEAHTCLYDPVLRDEYDAKLSREVPKPNFKSGFTEQDFEKLRKETELREKARQAELKEFVEQIQKYQEEQLRKKKLGEQLIGAIQERDYDKSQNLIQQGATLVEVDKNGFAAIHHAAKQEDENLLKLLLDSDTKDNLQTRDEKEKIVNLQTRDEKETILHILVKKKNVFLCTMLVNNYGALTHLQDHLDQTPLHVAIKLKGKQRAHEIQRFLIANPYTYIGFFGKLHSALDYQDYKKNTPLHCAILAENFHAVSLLKNERVRLDIKNSGNDTAIDLMKIKRIELKLPDEILDWLDSELEKLNQSMSNPGCIFL